MTRPNYGIHTGRRSRKGLIVRTDKVFVAPSGIEAAVWEVPNRTALVTGSAIVKVSLPRIKGLEKEVTT
jgi:hypothetical protein